MEFLASSAEETRKIDTFDQILLLLANGNENISPEIGSAPASVAEAINHYEWALKDHIRKTQDSITAATGEILTRLNSTLEKLNGRDTDRLNLLKLAHGLDQSIKNTNLITAVNQLTLLRAKAVDGDALEALNAFQKRLEKLLTEALATADLSPEPTEEGGRIQVVIEKQLFLLKLLSFGATTVTFGQESRNIEDITKSLQVEGAKSSKVRVLTEQLSTAIKLNAHLNRGGFFGKILSRIDLFNLSQFEGIGPAVIGTFQQRISKLEMVDVQPADLEESAPVPVSQPAARLTVPAIIIATAVALGINLCEPPMPPKGRATAPSPSPTPSGKTASSSNTPPRPAESAEKLRSITLSFINSFGRMVVDWETAFPGHTRQIVFHNGTKFIEITTSTGDKVYFDLDTIQNADPSRPLTITPSQL